MKPYLSDLSVQSLQRRRNTRDVKCVFFPDDVENGVKEVKREPSSLSAVSSANSWQKCGDSFMNTEVLKVDKCIMVVLINSFIPLLL